MDILQAHLTEIVGALALLAVFALVFWLVVSRRERREFGADLEGETIQRIREARRAGDELGVAEVLMAAARFEQAATVFARLGQYRRAGEAHERAGAVGPAIKCYQRAGVRERSARLAFEHGRYQLAARDFEAVGNLAQAAECQLKAGNTVRAAELFAEEGSLEEAGRLFARVGDRARGAEMFGRAFEEQARFARGDISSVPEAVRLAKAAAELLVKDERFGEAATLLARAGCHLESGDASLAAGDLKAAAKHYVKAGAHAKAAAVLEELGHSQAAAKCRGKAALDAGEVAQAAREFAAAGELVRAGDLFVEAGEKAAAAKVYHRAGEYSAAADLLAELEKFDLAAKVYGEAGEYDQAARMYESLGQPVEAARQWEKGGRYLEAGRILLESGAPEEALGVLSRASEFGDRGRHVASLKARGLYKLGRPDAALEVLQEVIGDQPPSAETLDLHYQAARCAEAAGRSAQAAELYRATLSVNEQFSDARQRLEALEVESPQTATSRQSGPSGRSGDRAGSPAAGPPSDGALATARYEILDEIARGGMGVVYRARDTVLNRVVAFKILSDKLKSSTTAVEYFLREARASAALSHPNIVTLFDAGEQNGQYYMAMELVEGETLKSILQRRGHFPEKLLRYVTIHACRGLAYAHDKGLIHRDIKSGNLMLTKDRQIKIMDFGLAKFVEEVQKENTRAVGTPYYMSPEQIRGRELDPRSDIYSLGITLFECATGMVPFAKGDLSYHHVHTPPTQPRQYNAKLSRRMNAVIMRCIQKDPADRFQSAKEILKAVKAKR